MTSGDRVAIVTGASTGIGRALAVGLAADGARVVIGYRSNAEGAAETLRTIEAAGGIGVLAAADIARAEGAQRLVDVAVEAFGRLDIMCCHAGLTAWGSFLSMTEQTFDRIVATNLRGTFFAAQAAARRLVAQGEGGRIALTSSVTAHRAIGGISAYAMTKAGIEALARNLAFELAPEGITVNAVAPGAIVNDRNLGDDPRYAERWAVVDPVGRVGVPEDVLAAVRFLVGPDAGFITGQTLIVDGGWTSVGSSQDHVEALAGRLGPSTGGTDR